VAHWSFQLQQSAIEQAKPDVYVVKENCAITPFLGSKWVLFKGVAKNKGDSPELAYARVEVSPPYLSEDNTTWAEIDLGNIAAGQAKMLVVIFHHPIAERLDHGTITVVFRIIGQTKEWDYTEFTESW